MEKAKQEEGQSIETGPQPRLTKVVTWDKQVTVVLTPGQERFLLDMVIRMAHENALGDAAKRTMV